MKTATVVVGDVATEIAYHDDGEGIPVLCSHSLFFHAGMFDTLTALYLAAGYRVIRPDHPGQGRSGNADDLSMSRLASTYAAFLEHLDVGPVHWVGNSQGGMVGLHLLVERPDLLRSLTPLGASAEEEYRLPEFGPLVADLGHAGGAANRIDDLMHIMFGASSRAADGEIVDYWREYMSRLPATIGRAAQGVIDRNRILEKLAGTTVPVLALAGEEDNAYPIRIAATNIAHASGGRSEIISGAGHSIALEKPHEVFQATTRHFGDADERAAT